MSVGVRPLETYDADAALVAANMRAVDVDELWALSRSTPDDAVRRSIRYSQDNYVGSWAGAPACVFGCHTATVGLIGVPWLLGTDELTKHARAFLENARRYVVHLRETHASLQNVVHSQNKPSVLFLTVLGFKMGEEFTTRTGAQARLFTMQGLKDV